MLSAYCLVMASKFLWLNAAWPARYVSTFLDAMAPPALSPPGFRRLLIRGFTWPGDRLLFAPTSVRAEPCRYVGRQVVETLNRRSAAWCRCSSAAGWPSSPGGPTESRPVSRLDRLLNRTARRPRVPAVDRLQQATLLLADGVPVKVVSERLGHASATNTLTVYQHVHPGMGREAADRFAALLEG